MINKKIEEWKKEEKNFKKNKQYTSVDLVEAATVALVMLSFFSKVETNHFLSWVNNIGSVHFLFGFSAVFVSYPLVLFIVFTIFDSKKVDSLIIVSFLAKEALINIDDDHCLTNIKQLIRESVKNDIVYYTQDEECNKDLAELNKTIGSYQANKLSKEKMQWVLKELLNKEEERKARIQSQEKTSLFLRFAKNEKKAKYPVFKHSKLVTK